METPLEAGSLYSEVKRELEKQSQEIKKSNDGWRSYFKKLLNIYWKDPKMKAEILDAAESIKYIE